ncbi:serine/threonine protein phosphatase, partial [Streptomyces alkaliphilus]|nr:serine/threonine protein phosphatase [Streptomyces alkaliphilus]
MEISAKASDRPRGTEETGAVWEAAPYPVLVVDAGGAVRRANHAAGALFPGVRPGARLIDVVPDWLSAAHHRGTLPRQKGNGAPVPPPVAAGPLDERLYEA